MNELVQKPWGTYQILYTDEQCQVKRIVVNPGHRPSLQSHKHRNEVWTVLSGEGEATVEDTKFAVIPESTIRVWKGQKHRIYNTGEEPLVFIEVQTGTSFIEEDIVRYEDDYDRD